MCKYTRREEIGYIRTSGYIIELVDQALENMASRKSHTLMGAQSSDYIGSASSNSEPSVRGMIEASSGQVWRNQESVLAPETEEVD
jgi:hypothetical protein